MYEWTITLLVYYLTIYIYVQGGDLIHLLNNEVPDIILQEDQEKQETILEKGRMPAREAGEYEFEVSSYYDQCVWVKFVLY
jgi:hypothetical protein